MADLIYAGLSLVEGPDRSGQRTMHFPPLTLPCIVAWVIGSATAWRDNNGRFLPAGMPKTVFLLDTVC